MNGWWYGLAAGVCLLAVGRSAASQRHPVRTLLAGAICGVGVLALLALTAPLTRLSGRGRFVTGSLALAAALGLCTPAGAAGAGAGSFLSATSDSVVSTIAATEAAFCRAERVTLVGSTIPAAIMSPYSSFAKS